MTSLEVQAISKRYSMLLPRRLILCETGWMSCIILISPPGKNKVSSVASLLVTIPSLTANAPDSANCTSRGGNQAERDERDDGC